ncbi:MAG: DUF2933 domain-containing protein [Halopseudomonas sp.]
MNKKNHTPWWKNGHHLMMLGCVMLMGYFVWGSNTISGTGMLLLIACPLMHLLMMKSMGGGNCHQHSEQNSEPEKASVNNPKNTLAQKEF